MQKAIGRALGLAALVLAALGSTANAQDTVRVRGTIERLDGPVYVVKARDGAELKITLMDNGIVVAIVKASLADIKPGLFVGSTGMPQPRPNELAALRDARPSWEKAWDRWDTDRDDPDALADYRQARDAWVDVVLRDVLGWRGRWRVGGFVGTKAGGRQGQHNQNGAAPIHPPDCNWNRAPGTRENWCYVLLMVPGFTPVRHFPAKP